MMKKITIFFLLFVFCFTNIVRAEFNSTAEVGWPLFINGIVNSVIPTNNGSLYVGGSFLSVNGTSTIGFGVFNTAATSTSFHFAPGLNQPTFAVTSDSTGRWYIGGNFTTVNGTAIGRVARLSATGTLDTTFNPNVGGLVNVLAVSPDDATLYVGGQFSAVNGGVTRNRLAAFSTASTGTVTSFNPALNSTSTFVSALAFSSDGSTLYAGGAFNAVNGGIIRNRLAAFSTASTGTVTSFDPNMSSNVLALALSSDDATLYVGGSFITVNGSVTRNRLAAFSTASTGTVTSFNPNADSVVRDIAISSNDATLYVGGDFITVNSSVTRNRLAAFSTASTGTVTSFDPNMGGIVRRIALSPDDATLYAGGDFATVNGSSDRPYFVGLSTATSAATALDINIDASINSIALSPDGSSIAAVGNFLATGISPASNLIRILPDMTIDSTFEPDIGGDISAMALSPDESTLYIGGGVGTVNGGISRPGIASLDTATGTVTDFDPGINGGVYEMALTSDGATLFVGGDFSIVNSSIDRTGIAAFDTATGTVTDFDPRLDYQPSALQLSSDDSILYATGGFLTAKSGTISTEYFAAFSSNSTGTPLDFNPGLDSPGSSLALSSDDATLYVGGDFATVNGSVSRDYLAAFSTASTGTVTNFNPGLNSSVNALTLSANDATLYAGGTFTTANGGQSRIGLTGISTSATGTVTSFNGATNNNIVSLAISSSGTKLYAGGTFTSAGSNGSSIGLAVFAASGSSDTTAPVVTVTGDNPAYFTIGNPYHEFGATATDDTDGTLSVSINTSAVDMNTAGTYTVTYSATDAALNVGSSTRTVIVNPIAGTVGVGNSSGGGGGGGSTPPPTENPATSTAPSTIDVTMQARIAELLEIVASLQAQLANKTPSAIFTRNLRLGDIGEDVRMLQKYLNTHGAPITATGSGSPGKETSYFGIRTQQALAKFQELHSEYILKPNGLTKGTGIFGSSTRLFVHNNP